MPLPTILLSRPRADSDRFAARLAGDPALAPLPVLIAPLLRIEPVPHDPALLAQADALLFTSAHAVPSAGAGRGRRAWCVGGHTAAAARAAGFDVVEGPGDAAGLAPMIAPVVADLIHPRGRHIARDLGARGVVVYDQVPQAPPPQALDLLAGQAPVILPLFSPRSARLAADMAAGARAPLWIAPISEAARAAWQGPAARCETAASPDAKGIHEAIRRLIAPEQS
ncbi:MAG: uroporphyrinogen-III synthase [Paracoccus sp. (in: a-proteobacteria)]|uniref:uroporphyrinogen-III synthase n=1 Tax=Paracoccus sp. TaxID=267 RepID=UPI0026DEC5DA|nr:uroporphyrinogen-III synthase [Paracoccus sp. (in: a-proteobacteria)]MDO5613369.1 uroporphyrinogen-III synthase [Paracoccus sp. (in: a-proteobacteria)]